MGIEKESLRSPETSKEASEKTLETLAKNQDLYEKMMEKPDVFLPMAADLQTASLLVLYTKNKESSILQELITPEIQSILAKNPSARSKAEVKKLYGLMGPGLLITAPLILRRLKKMPADYIQENRSHERLSKLPMATNKADLSDAKNLIDSYEQFVQSIEFYSSAPGNYDLTISMIRMPDNVQIKKILTELRERHKGRNAPTAEDRANMDIVISWYRKEYAITPEEARLIQTVHDASSYAPDPVAERLTLLLSIDEKK